MGYRVGPIHKLPLKELISFCLYLLLLHLFIDSPINELI